MAGSATAGAGAQLQRQPSSSDAGARTARRAPPRPARTAPRAAPRRHGRRRTPTPRRARRRASAREPRSNRWSAVAGASTRTAIGGARRSGSMRSPVALGHGLRRWHRCWRTRLSHAAPCESDPPCYRCNQLDKKSQAWSALFSEPMSELVQRYTASVGFDQRLWRADIDGALAHAEHAGRAGHHRRRRTCAAIERGMAQIRGEIEAGTLRLEARARGRAPEHRGAPDAAGRRRRQAAAHRPLAQRPGRHRRAAVAARRDRRDRRAAGDAAARAGRRSPSSTPRRSCPASPTCRWRSR